jgi:hypothetical protein
MPKTGYLTPMHSFIIGSTFFVTAVCVESLALYELRRRSAMREAVRYQHSYNNQSINIHVFCMGSV